MRTLRFKTNIESSQSVAGISNFIDNMDGVKNWEVDLRSPDRVLTIRGNVKVSPNLWKKASRVGYKVIPLG